MDIYTLAHELALLHWAGKRYGLNIGGLRYSIQDQTRLAIPRAVFGELSNRIKSTFDSLAQRNVVVASDSDCFCVQAYVTANGDGYANCKILFEPKDVLSLDFCEQAASP